MRSATSYAHAPTSTTGLSQTLLPSTQAANSASPCPVPAYRVSAESGLPLEIASVTRHRVQPTIPVIRAKSRYAYGVGLTLHSSVRKARAEAKEKGVLQLGPKPAILNKAKFAVLITSHLKHMSFFGYVLRTSSHHQVHTFTMRILQDMLPDSIPLRQSRRTSSSSRTSVSSCHRMASQSRSD
ncbi:hypothetical protein EXIGLDRAFT_47575 [Exidia glandulosa HHB12029]|uniref:Uncharacterized protein n=1 Tax=Exidia glandulosa HHB12029 TaxID=1314781 RepID=A0A165P5M3_EXIGL|nr:hypothetical protein EXIGLDRAFT_47575 [Exidia glandulosa HHB12029]